MAILQFKRGFTFIDPKIGEPFLDTNLNLLKVGVSGSDFITLLDSGSLTTSISPLTDRLDSIELTTASLNTSVSNLNSFTQSFNTAISLDSSNVTILGDLDVQGTTTTIDSTTITLGDNIIELNGTGASNGGILVNDVTNPNTLSGSLLWDGTNDYWKAGQLGSENEIITTANIVSNLPTNTISGSSQIDHDQTTNYSAAEHFLQSEITTVGTVTVGSVTAILPSGTVSGSSQIDVTQTTNYSSINQYSDTKVKTKLDAEGVISGSSQVDVTQTTNYSSINQYTDSDTQDYLDSIGVVSGSISGQLPSGTVSGSSQIDHDQTTNYSAAEHYTQENITTVGTVTTGNIDSILPTGTVSGSSQIDVTQTTNYSSINQYTDSDFDTRFGTKSTSDLSEGTNEYYTDTKVKTKLDVEGVISGSSQIDHDQTTNYSANEHFTQENITTVGTVTNGSVTAILPSGTVSGSSQIDITGGIPTGTVSGSSQIDHDQTTNFVTNEHIDHSSVSITAGSGLTGGGNITISRTLNVGAGDGINVNVDDIEVDSTVARTNQDNNFSSLQTFNDIAVNGTGSFAYIEQVTGSAKIIGDAFLILNNDTPAERYAGIKVLDSGSVTPTTASLQYDGQTNDWFLEYEDNGTSEHGIMMFGPEYSIIGAPTYLTNNTIPKADGGHHFNDSNITDNGSTITLDSTLYVTQSIVGIGTSSPTSLGGGAKLTVNQASDGNIVFARGGSTRQVQIGTTSTTGYINVDNTSGGFTFNVNTSERMRIDSSGNVGIGISPSKKLTVFGTGAGNATVQIEGEGGADPYINFLANNTQHWSLGVDDSDSDKFKLSEHSALGTNDYLVVDTSGNVGIGTTSPTLGKLVVKDDYIVQTDGTRNVYFGSDGTGGLIGTTTNHYTRFITNNTEAMHIDSSQNVGIGASPSFSSGSGLEIERAGIATLRLQNTSTGKSTEITQGTNFEIDTLNSGMDIVLDATTDTIFEIADSEIARINSTGLGIGTDSPAAKLDIKESSNAAGDAVIRLRGHGLNVDNTVLGALEFFNADSSGDQPGVVARVEAQSGNANGHMGELVFKTHDGSEGGEGSSPKENMRLDATGNLFVSGTIYAQGDVVVFSSSDKRLKDNLTQIQSPLSKITQINGYSFIWNNQKQHIYKGKDYGVVAQEIQKVLPELVQERKNGYLGVNYEKLVPLLIESIKELKTQVEHLNKKLENK